MNAEGHRRHRSCLQGSYLPAGRRGAACVPEEDAPSTVREAGTAFRGRKSAGSFLEKVLFAPDPEEQVGRKNGRNAVFLPGTRRGQGRLLSQGVCAAECSRVRLREEVGAKLWKALNAGQSKMSVLCLAGAGEPVCACRITGMLHSMLGALWDQYRSWGHR